MSHPTAAPDGAHQHAGPSSSRRTYRILMIFVPSLLLFGAGCTCTSTAIFPFGRAEPTSASETSLYLDIQASGVYTPTGDGRIQVEGQSEPAAFNLEDLAEKGYVAVRVPHAAPGYTASTLRAGASDGAYAGYFRYYTPPTSTVESIAPITLTRRSDLEPAILSRFPITDGRSHWEVWWLAAGETFPLPDEPFAVRAGDPPPLTLNFRVDFGPTSTNACNGCTYGYAAYDGGMLVGPYTGTLTYMPAFSGAYASFGTDCRNTPAQIETTGALLLTTGQPFSLTYCLESFDRIAHTFEVAPASTQGWDYVFYTQTTQAGSTPVLVGSAPFRTQVARYQGGSPGLMAIHAVFTPTFAANASIGEALQLQATSVASPTVAATGVSSGFSLAYDPQRAAEPKLYLPTLKR